MPFFLVSREAKETSQSVIEFGPLENIIVKSNSDHAPKVSGGPPTISEVNKEMCQVNGFCRKVMPEHSEEALLKPQE